MFKYNFQYGKNVAGVLQLIDLLYQGQFFFVEINGYEEDIAILFPDTMMGNRSDRIILEWLIWDLMLIVIAYKWSNLRGVLSFCCYFRDANPPLLLHPLNCKHLTISNQTLWIPLLDFITPRLLSPSLLPHRHHYVPGRGLLHLIRHPQTTSQGELLLFCLNLIQIPSCALLVPPDMFNDEGVYTCCSALVSQHPHWWRDTKWAS